MWMRMVVVASTVPITIVMNSFRIGVIGVLVNNYGTAQAEGFLHDFEGWVIFMACLAILVIEIKLLLRLSGDKRQLRDVLAIDWPQGRPAAAAVSYRTMQVPLVAVVAAVGLPCHHRGAAAADRGAARSASGSLPSRCSLAPGRAARRHRFRNARRAEPRRLHPGELRRWPRGAGEPVHGLLCPCRFHLLGAFPSSCLPGGGWRITENSRATRGLAGRAAPVFVNRAIIEQGDQRRLVYYWFQERGRNLTSEYKVKWYLLWDSATRQRTDGALVH